MKLILGNLAQGISFHSNVSPSASFVIDSSNLFCGVSNGIDFKILSKVFIVFCFKTSEVF